MYPNYIQHKGFEVTTYYPYIMIYIYMYTIYIYISIYTYTIDIYIYISNYHRPLIHLKYSSFWMF